MSVITDAAAAMNALTGLFAGTRDEMVNFLITPADGGPDLDGNVLMTVSEGVQVKRPSLAKLLTVVGGTQGTYFIDYAAMIATPGTAYGQMATVAAEDPGTHVEPGGVDSVPNPGYYAWTDGGEDPDFWKRLGNLITADIVAALTAAEAARDAILLNAGFIATSADLTGPNNIGAVAAALANIAAVVAALTDIEAAPQAAIDAGEARDEVITALASVPVGAGVRRLTKAPGDNFGQTGEAAFVETDGVLYTSKAADGWEIGVRLSDGAVITRDGQIDDLALGTLPNGITTTRAQPTTDLIAGETGSAYNTIASGTAVRHPSLGLLSFPQSEQFASDPTGPGNGSVSLTKSFAAGKVCVRIHGNGTLASSAGTATGSGYGAITEASGVQTIVLASTGTIAFSLSGSDANTQVQIEQSPLFPTLTVPTPFMPTAGVRDADRSTVSTDLLAALQADEGTVIFELTIPVFKGGTAHAILGVNSNTALLHSESNQNIRFSDGSNFRSELTGVGQLIAGMRVGLTWRSGRLAFMGGSRVPYQFATSLLAITTARLGQQAGTSDIYGQASLAGGIERYMIIDRATVTSGGDAMEFYDLVSEIKRPTIADFQNWDASDPLPIFKGRMAQLLAGTISSAPVVCTGPSHTAGVTGFANSWPKKLADRWAAAGLPAHSRTFFGANNNSLWASGTNPYDSRATYTGPAPTNHGKSLGGEAIRLSNGTALTLTFAEPATKIVVPYYTDAGRGSFTVSAGGSPIVPDEGGSSSISTNAALGITYKTFSVPGGATAWTITSTGTNDLAGLYDPTGIPVINGGRSGFTAVDMSNGSLLPESSYLLPLSVIQNLALTIMAPDNTNSSIGAITLATYRSGVQTQLDYAIARNCDVLVLTDPMSATSYVGEGTQQLYAGIIAQEAKSKGLPLFHLRRWQQTYGYTASHNSGWYNEAGISAGLHFGTVANDWMMAAPIADATLAALGMEQ